MAARWLAAALLLGLTLADSTARFVRTARHAGAAAGRQARMAAHAQARAWRAAASTWREQASAWAGRASAWARQDIQRAAPWVHRARQVARDHAAPALRALGWWLAWALVAGIEAAEAAGRITARTWRAASAFSREELRPRLHTSAVVTHVWLARAEVAADRWTTRAGIHATPWLERGRTLAAIAASRTVEMHVPRAWAWTRPRALGAARLAGGAAARALPRPGLLLSVALIGSLVAGASVATGMVLATPVLEGVARAVHVDVAVPVEFPPLAQPSDIVDSDGATLATLHDSEYRRIVALEDMPEHVRLAVIAAEDRRFYEHEGYDAVAIGRALEANLEATGIVQGGSTITQQLAKQNFVGDDRSVERKIREVIHAGGLEEAFGKDELLERYLNQVYFGSGAYGIAAAAEEFFRADPADLTIAQAALLAGQIRAPGAVDPRSDPVAAQARRGQVLERMAADGYIDGEQAREAHAEPVEVAPPLDQSPTEPHVVEAVKREFMANEAFGETREERWQALLEGGLVIETTLDQPLQTVAHEVVDAHVEALGGPTAALAAIEPGTGRVLAVAGGGDFADTKFDFATQSRRQPGSAFKTFALIAALEEGVDPDETLEGDSPQEHDLPHDQTWEVHNFGGATYGDVELREALVNSINTAFAELTLEVGHERVIDVATRLGIGEAAFGEPSSHGPSVALGGLTHGVSPLEMASAYGALAAGGKYAEPFLIEQVTGPDGKVLFERDIDRTQAVNPDIAGVALDLLQEVVQSGTGTAARIPGWPVAGKTGTTQNSADAWFAGAVPPLSVAVWIGHPDAQTPIPGLTGGRAAAPVWHDFVSGAIAGQEARDFDG